MSKIVNGYEDIYRNVFFNRTREHEAALVNEQYRMDMKELILAEDDKEFE